MVSMHSYPKMFLRPSYTNCYIDDHMDALLLIQAIIDNVIPTVERRPLEKERMKLIRSGNVFIFDEQRSQIQRWTDGISWSPSRIMGQFLLYREKEAKPYKKNRPQSFGLSPRVVKNYYSRPHSVSPTKFLTASPTNQLGSYLAEDEVSPKSEFDYLDDPSPSDNFKGLIKKTFSINYAGSTIRIVSYFTMQDLEEGRLVTPTRDPKFANLGFDSEIVSGDQYPCEYPASDDVKEEYSYETPEPYSSPTKPMSAAMYPYNSMVLSSLSPNYRSMHSPPDSNSSPIRSPGSDVSEVYPPSNLIEYHPNRRVITPQSSVTSQAVSPVIKSEEDLILPRSVSNHTYDYPDNRAIEAQIPNLRLSESSIPAIESSETLEGEPEPESEPEAGLQARPQVGSQPEHETEQPEDLSPYPPSVSSNAGSVDSRHTNELQSTASSESEYEPPLEDDSDEDYKPEQDAEHPRFQSLGHLNNVPMYGMFSKPSAEAHNLPVIMNQYHVQN